jgi:hypothetical protein
VHTHTYRDKNKHREREIQKHTHAHRQTNTPTHTHTRTNKHTHAHRQTHTHTQTDKHRHRHIDVPDRGKKLIRATDICCSCNCIRACNHCCCNDFAWRNICCTWKLSCCRYCCSCNCREISYHLQTCLCMYVCMYVCVCVSVRKRCRARACMYVCACVRICPGAMVYASSPTSCSPLLYTHMNMHTPALSRPLQREPHTIQITNICIYIYIHTYIGIHKPADPRHWIYPPVPWPHTTRLHTHTHTQIYIRIHKPAKPRH